MEAASAPGRGYFRAVWAREGAAAGGEPAAAPVFHAANPTPPLQSVYLLQASSSEVTAGSWRGSRRTVLAQASYEVMNFLFYLFDFWKF